MVRGLSGEWVDHIAKQWSGLAEGQALFLILPAYRPDVVERLARHLGVRFYDFRRGRLIPLGWTAASLPLGTLDNTAIEEMAGGYPLGLHNCETLLSLATPMARTAWFTEALQKTWPAKLLIPVVLFIRDLPDEIAGRSVTVEVGDLPPDILLDRLSSLR